MSYYGQFRQFFSHIRATIIKTVLSKHEFLFSALGSMVSRNMCKLRHKFKKKKCQNFTQTHWSWQNKPWFNLVKGFFCLVVELQRDGSPTKGPGCFYLSKIGNSQFLPITKLQGGDKGFSSNRIERLLHIILWSQKFGQ